jgi:hypothetical protein
MRARSFQDLHLADLLALRLGEDASRGVEAATRSRRGCRTSLPGLGLAGKLTEQ